MRLNSKISSTQYLKFRNELKLKNIDKSYGIDNKIRIIKPEAVNNTIR